MVMSPEALHSTCQRVAARCSIRRQVHDQEMTRGAKFGQLSHAAAREPRSCRSWRPKAKTKKKKKRKGTEQEEEEEEGGTRKCNAVTVLGGPVATDDRLLPLWR